ncbi:hypothetical protein N656DRAFT_840687 [Canariomyces notabilis]|uniref:Uncharacterized protein n=1 Tax=Canariomyces notabilis TaxID=2074819 RepID=A0AAN6YY03_9PEZI|nr:hypothetical protein N656DRAFT_840687 [Canariomyces arenarius]
MTANILTRQCRIWGGLIALIEAVPGRKSATYRVMSGLFFELARSLAMLSHRQSH